MAGNGILSSQIVHPVTGELLPDNLTVLEEQESRVDTYLRRQAPHYQYRRELREAIARLRGPAVLPRPRFRTDRQARVGACPRCGHEEER